MKRSVFISVCKGIQPDENGCMIWPRYRLPNGYGYARNSDNNHRNTYVHRWQLSIKLGRPVRDNYDACHVCDVPACVNPEHLFEGTRTDNMRDAVRKGRIARGSDRPEALVTENDVVTIRDLYANGGVTQQDIADKYGITQQNVHRIVSRKSWKHLQ